MPADLSRTTPVEITSEAERLLYELVAIPSPSGQEAEAAEYLVHWMAHHGLEAHIDDAGNAVGIRGAGKRDMVLLGHIDTIRDMIAPRLEGRVLYGRGAVDAKASLAAFVLAAARVRVPDGFRLVVIGATQEEVQSSLGAHHARRQYAPAACLIGEPSGWERITLGYRGHLCLESDHTGPSLHPAAPYPTPAERAVNCWLSVNAALDEFEPQQDAAFYRPSASLRELNTGVEGGRAVAHMQLDLRLPPGLPPDRLEKRLRLLLPDERLRLSGYLPPYVAEKNSPLVRALLRSIRSNGGQPRFVHKTGTSDMNVVGPAWRCPIAAYGPGDSRLDHTLQEHIHLDEFLRSTEILCSALRDLWREI